MMSACETCVLPYTELTVRPECYGGCCKVIHHNFPFRSFWWKDNYHQLDRRSATLLSDVWNSEAYRRSRSALVEQGLAGLCGWSSDSSCNLTTCVQPEKMEGYPKPSADDVVRLSNIAACEKNMAEGKVEVDHYPLSIVLFTGVQCNINCVQCTQRGYRDSRDPEYYQMHVEPFLPNLREFVSRACRIMMTGGEPMVSSAFSKVCEISAEENCLVLISTNALLYERKMRPIVRAGAKVSIHISIDAAEADVYERVRLGGKWDILRRNIDLMREDGVEFGISAAIFSLNSDQPERFVRFGQSVGAKYVSLTNVRNDEVETFFSYPDDFRSIYKSDDGIAALDKEVRSAIEAAKEQGSHLYYLFPELDLVGEVSPVVNPI